MLTRCPGCRCHASTDDRSVYRGSSEKENRVQPPASPDAGPVRRPRESPAVWRRWTVSGRLQRFISVSQGAGRRSRKPWPAAIAARDQNRSRPIAAHRRRDQLKDVRFFDDLDAAQLRAQCRAGCSRPRSAKSAEVIAAVSRVVGTRRKHRSRHRRRHRAAEGDYSLRPLRHPRGDNLPANTGCRCARLDLTPDSRPRCRPRPGAIGAAVSRDAACTSATLRCVSASRPFAPGRAVSR